MNGQRVGLVAAVLASVCGLAAGQTAPLNFDRTPLAIDSGDLEAPASGSLDDLRAAAADATGAIDDALRPRGGAVRNLWWAVE